MVRRLLTGAGVLALAAAASAQTHTIDFQNDALYPEPRQDPFPTTILHNLTDGIVTFISDPIIGSCCWSSQAQLDSHGFDGPPLRLPIPNGPYVAGRFARVQCFTDSEGKEGSLEMRFATPVKDVQFDFGTTRFGGGTHPTITINVEAFDASGASMGVTPFTTTVNVAPAEPGTAEGRAELPDDTVVSRLRFTGAGPCSMTFAYQFAIDNVVFTEATVEPPCEADFDGQNGVQVADIFAFLRAWFANAPSADFDGENGIQVADIFAFLRSWFAGC